MGGARPRPVNRNLHERPRHLWGALVRHYPLAADHQNCTLTPSRRSMSVPNRRKTKLGWNWGRQKLAEIFGADLRSLAALRIVLALTVLFDLASRAANLAVHYSDGGILPRRVQSEKIDPWLFSLNFMNGTAEFQWALFAVAAVAAVAMLVGYRTRLMMVIVWLLVMSIQWRNYLIGYSADEL